MFVTTAIIVSPTWLSFYCVFFCLFRIYRTGFRIIQTSKKMLKWDHIGTWGFLLSIIWHLYERLVWISLAITRLIDDGIDGEFVVVLAAGRSKQLCIAAPDMFHLQGRPVTAVNLMGNFTMLLQGATLLHSNVRSGKIILENIWRTLLLRLYGVWNA